MAKDQTTITLGVLGCGKLATAILQGLLSNQEVQSTPTISRILATVRSETSIQRTKQKLDSILSLSTTQNTTEERPEFSILLQEENASVVLDSDIVILGCKPYAFQDVLGEPHVRSAFSGTGIQGTRTERKKILVSILGGISTDQLRECLYCSNGSSNDINIDDSATAQHCEIIRAIPNMAARIRSSMTVISLPDTPDPISKPRSTENHSTVQGFTNEDSKPLDSSRSLVAQLFNRIGAVEFLPENLMDNGATLCTSTTAIFATLVEAIAASDGARAIDNGGTNGCRTLEFNALRMAAQAARGAAELLLDGQSPEEIRNEVATPGGSTRRGLDAMEKFDIEGKLKEAMKEIFEAVGGLGVRK